MNLSDASRATRKQQQTARLAAKESDPDGYPAFYAAQPVQVAKAEANEEIRQAKVAVREAARDLELAKASGVGIQAAEARLVTARAQQLNAEDLKARRFPKGAANLAEISA